MDGLRNRHPCRRCDGRSERPYAHGAGHSRGRRDRLHERRHRHPLHRFRLQPDQRFGGAVRKPSVAKNRERNLTAARKYQGYTGGTKIDGGVFKYNSAGSLGQAGSANLVKNGDFESASISGKYAYTTGTEWSANPYWTCDGVNAGLDKGKNSNTMFESGIDVGTYAAYLRTGNNGTTDFGDGWFEQTITCFIPGLFCINC